MEPEIVIQDPPESLERVHANPDAEVYLVSVLNEFKKLYDTACETKAMEIKMGGAMFTNIASTIQKAWESVQTAQHIRENAIPKSLKHIQASITGLEQKYDDIQVKATENNAEIAHEPNEIQATTTCLENTTLSNAQSRRR